MPTWSSPATLATCSIWAIRSLALRVAVERQERHEIDADHAALVGNRLDRLVGGVARMVGQRARAGMADHQRPLGEGRGLGHRPRAAVAEVEQQLLRLDPLDRRLAELGQPAIARLERAVAREIARCCRSAGRSSRRPSSSAPAGRARARPSTVSCVPMSDAELLLALGLQDVGGASDQQQPVGVGVEDVLLGRRCPSDNRPRDRRRCRPGRPCRERTVTPVASVSAQPRSLMRSCAVGQIGSPIPPSASMTIARSYQPSSAAGGAVAQAPAPQRCAAAARQHRPPIDFHAVPPPRAACLS